MNVITTALIALDLSWVQDRIRENESTGYSSLTRALVLASQAGRMTRLLRVMNLVGIFRVRMSAAEGISVIQKSSAAISACPSGTVLLMCCWQESAYFGLQDYPAPAAFGKRLRQASVSAACVEGDRALGGQAADQ